MSSLTNKVMFSVKFSCNLGDFTLPVMAHDIVKAAKRAQILAAQNGANIVSITQKTGM